MSEGAFMRREATGLALVTVLAAAIAVGCGGKSGGNGGGGTPTPTGTVMPSADSYNPVKVGWSWTYQGTDASPGGTPYVRSVAVGPKQSLSGAHAGTQAFAIRSDYDDGSYKIEFDDDLGPVTVRYREEKYAAGGSLSHSSDFVPSKLRLDQTAAHTTQGASWEETYDEVIVDNVNPGNSGTHHHDEMWTVTATAQPVVALNGTSYDCLVTTKTGVAAGSATKTFKWSKGVGKIFEDDQGEKTTEMLSDYTPGP
jgi:hypothetical protein